MTPNPTSQIRCTLGHATFTKKSTKKWHWKAGRTRIGHGNKPVVKVREIIAKRAGALYGGNGIKIGSTAYLSAEIAHDTLKCNPSFEGVNFRIVIQGKQPAASE